MTRTQSREPIAIVGIGCRLPGSDGPQGFWRFLEAGADAIQDVPPERWTAAHLVDDPNGAEALSVGRAGLLGSVEGFDWRAFRIPPREAKYLDPQHRLLLEVAWEALEDAGLPFESIAGSRTGVYLAMMWNDYLRLQSREPARLTGYSTTGNGFAFGPNRISFMFDFRGPSVALDGACAGSLVSIHVACQALALGEADMALAGGVNLMLSPDVSIMLARAGVLSPTGRCMTLDARADGFVRGEGAGIVVLKRGSDVTPEDRVYAMIRGSAFNHNGHNEWIMAASREGQEAVLRDAYRVAGIDPSEVDYVELHGTGLPKGDPLEASALGAVVGRAPGRRHPCMIGSVKSNIGHLDSAAGIAGLIKATLALHHGRIPPTVNLEAVNPAIDLDELGLAPQRDLGPWPATDRPSLAGVTAVSMSGVNAHVVLEAVGARQPTTEAPTTDRHRLLPLSAPSPESLTEAAAAMAEYLASDPGVDIGDICFTAAVRRTHHSHRIAVMFRSSSELVDALVAFAEGGRPASVYSRSTADEELAPEILDEIRALSDGGAENAVTSAPTATTLSALGVLYVRGTIEGRALHPGGRCVTIPTTRWQREPMWLEWLDPDEVSSIGTDHGAHSGSLARILEATPPEQRHDRLYSFVRDLVANVLGIEPQLVTPRQGLFDLGLTSLSAVEVVNLLRGALEASLPETLVFEFPTARALTDHLAGLLPAVDRTGRVSPAEGGGRTDIVSRLEEMTDEEAEALLLARVKGITGD